jgi:TatD DNase family protein
MSGIVSFKNASAVHEVAMKVPADRLLIETDSPYLAPAPHRGKLNEPAFVSFVAKAVASLRGVSVESIGEQTTKNFFRLFNKIESTSNAVL